MFEKIIIIGIYLLTAHFIADFSLQNRWMAENKGKYWYIMFAHVFIYAGIISIVLNYLDMFYHWQFFILFISHYFIDRWKCNNYNPKKSEKENLEYLYVDQSLHFLILFLISL